MMGDFMFIFFLFLGAMVSWDLFTYESRQRAWEKAHPGKTYIRGYRKKS